MPASPPGKFFSLPPQSSLVFFYNASHQRGLGNAEITKADCFPLRVKEIRGVASRRSSQGIRGNGIGIVVDKLASQHSAAETEVPERQRAVAERAQVPGFDGKWARFNLPSLSPLATTKNEGA
jgi:hypothetical protein